MSAKYIRIHPENPDEKKIKNAVDILKNGGVIIYPTDSVYSIGCDINNQKAMEKLARIKQAKLEKTNFSFICNTLSEFMSYVKPVNNNIFKILKKSFPGPFTFILEPNNNLPKYYKNKKEIGIRIPNNLIPLEIVKLLGNPISSTSVYDEDEIIEYTNDAEVIYDNYKNIVDLIIDGGEVGLIPSTIINLVDNNIRLVRKGLGDIDSLL